MCPSCLQSFNKLPATPCAGCWHDVLITQSLRRAKETDAQRSGTSLRPLT